jgi:hypothetical protein
MTRVQIRIPLGLGQQIHDTVFAGGDHEYVAFCLVGHETKDDITVLFVRHVLALGDDDYLNDVAHGAAWRGTSMLPAIDAAMAENLGILLVHAHPFGQPPRLSTDDLRSAQRILPMLQRRVPLRPHGSIVLSSSSAGGIVALPGASATAAEVTIHWMGKSIVRWPVRERCSSIDDTTAFDRQGLVVGDQGELSQACVAVVGLCGGGSHVVQQLAHSGVGTIVGIDGDICAPTNLHRKVGMRRRDGLLGTKKIEIMDRLVRSVGTGSKFVGIDARVPEPKTLNALKSADVIVGCVDNLHARADIQEVAWRNVIPYVDVGVSIRALEGGASAPRVAIGGNVYVFVPGGFCAWCCGFISKEKLGAEVNGRDRSYFENKKGGAQVVSFNGVVASQAVSEALQLLTAFRGASFDPKDLVHEGGGQRGVLKYDGRRGTLAEWGGTRREACTCCSNLLGAGAIAWRAAS